MRGLHTIDASLPVIEQACNKYNVARAMVMATYFPYKGTGVPNMEMLERINGNKQFALIGSLDVMNRFDEGLIELESLARERKIVGVKLFAGYQSFRVSDAKMYPLYALCEHYRLPVTIHGGELHHCCPRDQRERGDLKCQNSFCWIDQNTDLSRPGAFARAIRLFPNVNFVIAHLANPYFDELRQLMTDFPNVSTDTSGQFLSGTDEATPEYKKEIITELRAFLALPNGEDRLMFGSDFPIQSFEDTIELIDALHLPRKVREKIEWKNANRLYRLGLTGGKP